MDEKTKVEDEVVVEAPVESSEEETPTEEAAV